MLRVNKRTQQALKQNIISNVANAVRTVGTANACLHFLYLPHVIQDNVGLHGAFH